MASKVEASSLCVYYFAYGSNMSTSRLEKRVGKVWLYGTGRLNNYALKFNKIGSDGTGKANIVEAAGSSVWGVLFKLTEKQLKQLDVFEGANLESPHYERKSIQVSGLFATTYVATPHFISMQPLAVSQEYLKHIIDGAREHGIKTGALSHL